MSNENKDQDSRESLDSSLESTPLDQPQESSTNPAVPDYLEPKDSSFKKVLTILSQKSSIYLPIFFLLIVAVVAVTIIDYKHSTQNKVTLAQQTLTPSDLNHIANSNEVVGGSNQVLTVQSSSVFDGQVLVRNDLQVAGRLQVGGSLSITGVVVSGSSIFNTVQINKNLSVGGNSNIQGTLAVQNNISVNGGGTFGGAVSAPQITTSSLQLNGDLNLTHHITAGGPIPGHSTSGNVGSGGTSSISGSDSSGTVTINTGSGPSAGCYETVNFVTAFNSTPHVLVTPVGASSATLNYYVNRSTGSFSICSANTPASGTSYVYDYFVID